jgi:predicted nucleic acid-binding Zn ribbon protein
MKKLCTACERPFIGRSDKRFCSVECKNAYNNERRKNTRNVVKEIDYYLHRNREILQTLMGNAIKETIDRLILVRTGFRFDYMTGIYFNKEQKMYRLVYDYAWMDFSDQKILIVRKTTTTKDAVHLKKSE